MRLPARWSRAVLAVTACLFISGMLKPARGGPEDLQVRAELEERADGLLELHLVWQWDDRCPTIGRRQEELLAVSFDTRVLLFETEEASYGVGARGESISLLERVSGFNGGRRFYVVPQGRDGEARVVLRPTGRRGGGEALIRIHAVVDPGQGEAAVREMVLLVPHGAGTWTAGFET